MYFAVVFDRYLLHANIYTHVHIIHTLTFNYFCYINNSFLKNVQNIIEDFVTNINEMIECLLLELCGSR